MHLYLIPIVVGLLGQLIKTLFSITRKNFTWHKLPSYGGFPSSHATFAFSLLTVVGLKEGVGSAAFVIAVFLVIIIIDDALRMRIYLGDHGKVLNMLIKDVPQKNKNHHYPYLAERLGHRWHEVLGGALFGVALTYVIYPLFA